MNSGLMGGIMSGWDNWSRGTTSGPSPSSYCHSGVARKDQNHVTAELPVQQDANDFGGWNMWNGQSKGDVCTIGLEVFRTILC